MVDDWQLVFTGSCVCWGAWVFVRIVALEMQKRATELEYAVRLQEEKAQREALLPVATAMPITIDQQEASA